MSTAPFELEDPRYEKRSLNFLDRFFLKYIRDERDLPFIYLTLIGSLVFFPFAVYLFLPGNFTWWLAAIYLATLIFGFLDRFILMLHNTSHRSLFKKEYGLLNHYIPWVLSPFFGETPDTYYVHHVMMHHAENNLDRDLSSTMRYQRDNFFHFLHYFFRFFFLGIWELGAYQIKKGRKDFVRRMFAGELGFYVLVTVLMFVNWQATLTVFVIPFVFVRFMMMAGNWGQHAFIDRLDPGNSFKNSITCINSRYNERAFNDGYHISHHIRPTRHWTDHPKELEVNWKKYRDNGSVIFEGTDFFEVWGLLMLKRYDVLARKYVDLREDKLSRDEVVELLKERTRKISVDEVPHNLKRNELPPQSQGAVG
jgi:hypothetical protein